MGFTSKGVPFLSLCTISEDIKDYFVKKIFEITSFDKKTTRNKRDGAYNISITRDTAKAMSNYLYYDGCLSLSRKFKKAKELRSWTRPDHFKKKPNSKWWTEKEDNIIMNNSVSDSMHLLERSNKSIRTRIYRLKRNLHSYKYKDIEVMANQVDLVDVKYQLKQMLCIKG